MENVQSDTPPVAGSTTGGVSLHKRHVQPFVAWTAVLGMVYVGIMPSMILAQQETQTAPPPTQMQSPPPPPPDSIIQQGQFTPPPTGSSGQFQPQPPPDGQFQPQPGQFQQQPQQGQFGQQPPQGGQFGPGERQGPSEEEMEKRMQEEQKKMLQRMKRDMLRFGGEIKRIKARIAVLQKKGIKVPEELVAAITKAEEMIEKIKAAETFEQIEELNLQEVMPEISEAMQEHLPNLERLANLTQIYSRIDRQVRLFERQLTADKNLAKRSKVDLSDAVADFENALNKVKGAYALAKSQIASGAVEEGFEQLESEVFALLEEAGEFHQAIQQIGRLSTTLAQIARTVTQAERDLARIKGKDTTEAKAIIAEAKAKLAELRGAAAAKPIDPEAVFDLLEQLEDLRDRFNDALNELRGIEEKSDLDTGLQIHEVNVPLFGDSLGGSIKP